MHSTTLLGINALMGVGYELNYDQKSEPETNQEIEVILTEQYINIDGRGL